VFVLLVVSTSNTIVSVGVGAVVVVTVASVDRCCSVCVGFDTVVVDVAVGVEVC